MGSKRSEDTAVTGSGPVVREDMAPAAAGASAAGAAGDYDVIVVGGGMAGAALAIALDGLGLKLALVEASSWHADAHPGYDERTLALSWGSRRIFDGLGVWTAIAAQATPIRQIDISDRGHIGHARLDARDQGTPALGYVAAARTIGAALIGRLERLAHVTLLCPAELEHLSPGAQHCEVTVRVGEQLHSLRARLVVAADGARSRIRTQLGVPTLEWSYGQTAVTANVTPEHDHGNVAYERFTEDGPLALLPMEGGRCALVLTVPDAEVEPVLAMPDAQFQYLVQRRFGLRLGRFVRAGRRSAHPLKLVKAREHRHGRVAFIGNAAHTLHPIAGQGFNLGLRDVAVLAEVIADALSADEDPGSSAVLTRYADWRRWDQRATIGFTDALVRVFANPLPPVRLARNLGLIGFDLLPPVKRLLVRQLMGVAGRQPRLGLGRALAG